jgi:hypothetical protein
MGMTASTAGTAADGSEVLLVGLGNALLRRRTLITWSVVVCLVAVAGTTLVTPRTWTQSLGA